MFCGGGEFCGSDFCGGAFGRKEGHGVNLVHSSAVGDL